MKTRVLPFRLLAAPLLAALVYLTGCSGAPVSTSWPGITVADKDNIFIAYTKVYAVDGNGKMKWAFPTTLAGGQAFFAAPAVDGNLVVVTDYVDTIFGLDREKGTQTWIFKSNRARFVGAAVIGEKYVYAGTVDGVVHALNKEDGTEAWKFATGGNIWSTPLLDGGALYVTSLDKHLYVLDETGKLQWKYPPGETDTAKPPMGAIVGTPTLHEGVLYFGSFNNHVYALDTATRTVKWTYPTSNWVWSSPIYDDSSKLLIGADLDGNVFGLNPEDGKQIWHFEANAPVVGAPLLANLDDGTPVAYLTAGLPPAGDSNAPNLYILKTSDGSKAVQPQHVQITFNTTFLIIPTGSSTRSVPIFAAPVAVNDMLLVGSHDASTPIHLIALDSKTFDKKWEFDGAKQEADAQAAKSGGEQTGGIFGNQTFLNTLLIVSVVLLLFTLLTGRRGGSGGKK